MPNKRYIIELGHPKHYHMFKGFIRHYREKGNKVTVLARNKDVLLKLLEADDCRYTKFGPYTDGLLNKLFITPLLLANYFFILLKARPHVVFSKASPYASFFSKLFRFNHVIFPDSDGFKSNDILMKYARVIVTPSNYNNDYGEKHKKVDGFFENLYLHPNRFSPDPDVPRRYQINPDERYTVGIYTDEDHCVKAVFTGRKVRRFPADIGDNIVGESCTVPETNIGNSIRIVEELQYSGIAEFEYKKDAVTGEYKLIEINPRSWSWI